jgi:molybdenum cofactor biosynthesis enzyme MoaA
MRDDIKGTMPLHKAFKVLLDWTKEGLQNVRFSGGEPTLYNGLEELVAFCKIQHVKRIAVSTNGSADLSKYLTLLEAGVNDFSISLDSGCCSIGDVMAGGIQGSWKKVTNNIRELSKLTYVTVGMVFTEQNVDQAVDSILFADSLGVADIRIISSSQYNEVIHNLWKLPEDVINRHPILKYRIHNYVNERPIRGILHDSCNRCKLALDDMAIAGNYHFPCIIYMRQGGDPIGRWDDHNVREQRKEWSLNHDTSKDPICSSNCLDVCVDFNDKAKKNVE